MLSREDNELLCRVGRGTPMGDLLRHYWMPCLPSSELPAPDERPQRFPARGEEEDEKRDSGEQVDPDDDGEGAERLECAAGKVCAAHAEDQAHQTDQAEEGGTSGHRIHTMMRLAEFLKTRVI